MPRPPLRYAVKGIYPGMGIVTIKRTVRHKDARHYIMDRGGRLENRYGMTLYISSRI